MHGSRKLPYHRKEGSWNSTGEGTKKTTKEIVINHKGTRMFKDGEV